MGGLGGAPKPAMLGEELQIMQLAKGWEHGR
jgi:hypothetical protein